jgi:hypothetical protein
MGPKVPEGVLFLVSSYNIGRLTMHYNIIFNNSNIFVYSRDEVSFIACLILIKLRNHFIAEYDGDPPEISKLPAWQAYNF